MKKLAVLIIAAVLSVSLYAMGNRVSMNMMPMHMGHDMGGMNEHSHATADSEKVICPVTGTEVAPETAYDKVEYQGKTYYFCCSACKPEFLKDPEKYIK